MPGPISLANPFAELAANLRQARRQNIHPVYNASGVKVGSYDTLDALCQGQWFKFTGVAQPPVSQLYVRDFWGRRVPLSTQCVRAAQATAKGGAFTQPQPVSPAAAAKAVGQANQAVTGTAAPIDLNALLAPPTPGGGATIDQQTLTTYALWGGLALVGLVLLSDSGGRRR
jgi:hypothetical protein